MATKKEAAIAEVMAAQMEVEAELLAYPNAVGVATGFKVTKGQVTDQVALMVLVPYKIPEDVLPAAARIPTRVKELHTDVLEVGLLFAADGAAQSGIQSLATRRRPVEGGYSVGHKDITAGTIATAVYDKSSFPGIPPHYYILSNNHVLANSNAGVPGDAILQPGPYDGGTDPADRIAILSRFVPIQFEPPIPRAAHNNLVDAAIAEAAFADIDREVYWIGVVRGWRPRANVTLGTGVQKTGRTTHYTTGRITAINATVDVGYSGGRVARFRDQMVLSNMSAPGDSGSLITTLDGVAVGLLFAGSNVATIACQIEHVQNLLGVLVAQLAL